MDTIDLDPARNSREITNVPATRHYTAEDNGLVQPWVGWVFLNPPFGSGVEQWFSKIYQERAPYKGQKGQPLIGGEVPDFPHRLDHFCNIGLTPAPEFPDNKKAA